MSLNLKDDILNAVKEVQDLDAALSIFTTPKFRKPTPPPPPTSGSNAVKSSPPNIGSSVQFPKKPCTYETPCGWCTKWDKKCDKKIGGGNDIKPRKKKNAVLEYIKSGKGLPPLDTNDTWGLELRP